MLQCAPITPAEKHGQNQIFDWFVLEFCCNREWVSSKRSENQKKKKMTELVNEVREMKEGIRAGLEKLSEGKETELKVVTITISYIAIATIKLNNIF